MSFSFVGIFWVHFGTIFGAIFGFIFGTILGTIFGTIFGTVKLLTRGRPKRTTDSEHMQETVKSQKNKKTNTKTSKT